MKYSIGIIGGGITGLASGYELSKKGHKVTIFERSQVPGGLGTYIPVEGNYIERYYHHFFQTDHYIISYAKELRISDKLKFYKAKTGIFSEGKIYPFSSAIDLLKFAKLSVFDRLRCGVTTAILKFTPFPIKSLDTISAATWIKKYAGKSVYEKIWGPLLEGKFSQFAEKISALWLWGRVYDRSFKLGYFDGSVKILFDALIAKIKKLGGEIRLNSEIIKVLEEDNKVAIYEKGKKFIFDKVIFTTVSPITEKIIQSKMPSAYRSLLSSIDHLGAICLILELSRSIQSQYWLNICEKNSPVLVMIEHTNMLSKKDYGERTIVYLANYIHKTDKRFQLTDDEIINTYTSILSKINPQFKKTWVKKTYISRVPRAQTIFETGALKRIPSLQTPLKNIYLANIDQMYPHDRNLNQGIELGTKVALAIDSLSEVR